MSKRNMFGLLICITAALCVLLCGCEADPDDNVLDTPANYSINIALPYATVTPPPVVGDETQPLVIDSEGSVIVNDSSILNNAAVSSDEEESNYKSLSIGNTGLAVQALQYRLYELGYYTQGVSGIFDDATESAVRRFEQTYGTMQTGVATPRLQARLFAADAPVYASEAYTQAVVSQYTVLQRGDAGSPVYALQQRLKSLGYPIGNLTGVFDSETANAVMLFYVEYGFTPSDIANVALQKEIYSDSARKYSGSETADTDSDSETVVKAQELLIRLGYLNTEADGILDAEMVTAVKLFEEACGQFPSGIVSAGLIKMLEAPTAPSFSDHFGDKYPNLLSGSSGDDVLRLQNRLVELGFATGTPTGEYGSATTASIKLFQRCNGMAESGIANAYMQAVLYASFALNIHGETIVNVPVPEEDDIGSDAAGSDTAQDTMVLGSSGDDVLRLQNRLTSLGYVSAITGTYDNLTSRAISMLQTAAGIDATGTADSDLLLFIFSTAVPNSSTKLHDSVQSLRRLAIGDSGDDVTALQKKLWEMNLLAKKDIADSVGTYNDATAEAVKKVQEKLGYETLNGVAGAVLQSYLYSDKENVFGD